MRLVLLCVETNKKAKTDESYIGRTVKYFYKEANDVKISFDYFQGKTKYYDKGLLQRIQRMKKFPSCTQSDIIYCVDTDKSDVDKNIERENAAIAKFCRERGFELVWFNRDIEEVFLHKSVPDSDKVAEAKKFKPSDELEKPLSANTVTRRKSNLLTVLDKYLCRK